LAVIGRNRAVADVGRLKVAGLLGWWMWVGIHIAYLAGFRNRLSVMLEWAYAYFTFRPGARLITEEEHTARIESPARFRDSSQSGNNVSER
jgi:NADH dehydrogenase